MNTIQLNDDGSAIMSANVNGLQSFQMISGPAATSQLVKNTLLILRRGVELEPDNAVDWIQLMETPSLVAILGNQLSGLIGSLDGVESVDLTKTQYQLQPHLSFTGICFTHSCGTQTELSI